ncbi:MAG: YidC/Oxa1 family membrane protein insertase [Christensenellales bacterium]|nr:YidC/Oxa1 family membrane protein insertase [Christensenellales bacterium]
MFDWINILFTDCLNWIYSWIGNYGWAVVIFTLIVRLLVLPLDIKSRKSMRAMNRVQPKMQALQKKYANDKEKLNAKMMELYKKEKVSPMAGCLPMLLQWPVLIFMFTAMRVVANEHTIQMILDLKNGLAPSFESWLWIKNVFLPDSFGSSMLPAVGSQLREISQVGYSSILNAENIAAAREFLSSSQYAAIAAQYGANAFTSIQLNFFFFQPVLTLPNSVASLFQYANGLFVLPVLAAASQFLMTRIMTGTQKKTPEQKLAEQENPAANAMNSGMMKWFFPLFSLWICASSNSAFSIYWMAVNVITIVQSLILNYIFDRQEAAQEALKAD